MKRVISDSLAMSDRCLRTTFRNPDAFVSALIVPAIVMWLFGVVFSNIMDFGDISVVNFILPGLMLQTMGQSSLSTGISINNDMTKGIIDRFRSMPISKSAVLTGHVIASTVKNIFTVIVTVVVALLIGFRPQASFTEWLIIAGIIILIVLALTWISVVGGLLSSNAEAVQGKLFLLFVLPYLSTGFVPVEAVDARWLRWFIANQPMTPIIETLRGLMLGFPLEGNTMMLALAWTIGIIVVAFTLAVQVYKRKMS
ncbi:MAG: ABC transporter permease [Firmicutes bacterium]|nr:ABC transporter permease [Bacillota bacterium]